MTHLREIPVNPMKETAESGQIALDEGGARATQLRESSGIMSMVKRDLRDEKAVGHDECIFRPRPFNGAYIPPVWWFRHFDPCWAPLTQWLSRKQNLSPTEFEFAADHVPGLTSIEKTIARSAFVVYKHLHC